MPARVSREGILLAVILLASFLSVDRFLVRTRARAYAKAAEAMRSAEDRLFRARTEANRAARIAGVFGEPPGGRAPELPPIAINYLNGLLADRGLRDAEVRSGARASGARTEAIELTVRGSYARLTLFIRDLESSQVPVWLRDVRMSQIEQEGGATLEMRVRLEIEESKS